MEAAVFRILDAHRIMAISTVRPDGWPHTTIVGYANDRLTLYFLIFRSSRKFANIMADDRVSVAIGEEPRALGSLEALYGAGHAAEVTNAPQRARGWELLQARHPNLGGFDLPQKPEAALMRLDLERLSILDFTQGVGYSRDFAIGPGEGPADEGAHKDEWAEIAAADKDGGPPL